MNSDNDLSLMPTSRRDHENLRFLWNLHRDPLTRLAVRRGSVYLLVFAIILTFFLLPTLMPESEKALHTYCLSNQKHLALGFMMYAEDYDHHFPPAASWQVAVTPYVLNGEKFFCPKVPRKPEEKKIVNTYAFNSRLDLLRQDSLREPQGTVMLFESDQNVVNAAGGPALLVVPGRHTGGNIFTFADGHAKFIADGKRQRFGVQ